MRLRVISGRDSKPNLLKISSWNVTGKLVYFFDLTNCLEFT